MRTLLSFGTLPRPLRTKQFDEHRLKLFAQVEKLIFPDILNTIQIFGMRVSDKCNPHHVVENIERHFSNHLIL